MTYYLRGNKAMTNKEVKNNFVQNLAENAYINMCSVEEMNIAIKALEKQIPKKPFEKEVIGVSMTGYKHKGQCPKCSSTVLQYKGNYCPNCGQALDWSEVKK